MMVHNLPLPDDCLVVAIRRQDQFIVPHGPTQIRATDRAIIHCSQDGLATMKRLAPRLFSSSA